MRDSFELAVEQQEAWQPESEWLGELEGDAVTTAVRGRTPAAAAGQTMAAQGSSGIVRMLADHRYIKKNPNSGIELVNVNRAATCNITSWMCKRLSASTPAGRGPVCRETITWSLTTHSLWRPVRLRRLGGVSASGSTQCCASR